MIIVCGGLDLNDLRMRRLVETGMRRTLAAMEDLDAGEFLPARRPMLSVSNLFSSLSRLAYRGLPRAPLAGRGQPVSTVQPYGQLSRRQRALTMGLVMLAMFLATLGQMSLATAMPVIVADLGGFDRYTWAATSYLVAATVAIPIAGRLADIYGRRIFFVLGLSIFIAASVPAGLSATMTQLIAFRALQGIGGGIIMSNSSVAVADLYAPEERGKYVGLLGLVYAVSSVLGPIVAGVITDSVSWSWIFLMNVPLGIPVLLLLVRFFPRVTPAVERRGLDYPGMAALTLAVVPLMVALSLAGERYAWASPQVAGLLAFGLVMAAAFVVIEKRSDFPIMPLEIYGNRMVAASVVVTFLTGFAL